MAPRRESFLDRPAARVVAGLVIIAVAALLAVIHRHDLFPTEETAEAANPELAACIAERAGHVDTMVEQGVIDAERAQSFRARAIQFCEQTAGQ